MANELTLEIKFTYAKSGTEVVAPDSASRTTQVDVAATNVIHNRQTVGTSQEAMVLGDVTAGGWCLIINRDATNFVQFVEPATGAAFARMLPGEPCLFRLDGTLTAPNLKANTAACEVEYWLLEA